MTRMPRRSASSLVATVVFFAVCTVTTTIAQDCVPYNSSYTAGTPDETPIAVPSYFRCPDDGFLLTVDASYYTSIYSLSWTCSGGEEIGSLSSASSGDSFAALTGSGVADGPVSFSVAITEVSTEVQDYSLPLLSHTHFGGYDVDTTGADITFSWGDSFGYSDEENVYLPDEYFSFCSSGSFATGVTVWSSSNYVYGIMLECAYATATCLPPNYPTSLLADSSSSTTDPATTSPGSTVPVISTPSPFLSTSSATDPPSPPTSRVVATGTPNPYGDTAPIFDTPSPSAITNSGADTRSPSATSVSTRSSSSSASTIVVGASVAGGLCFLAICAGLICGCHRRESRKTRHPDKPQDTFGAPAATGGGGGDGGIAPKDGIVTQVVDVNEDPVAADPSPPDEPPPPYSEHPRFRQAPPPYPSDLA